MNGKVRQSKTHVFATNSVYSHSFALWNFSELGAGVELRGGAGSMNADLHPISQIHFYQEN